MHHKSQLRLYCQRFWESDSEVWASEVYRKCLNLEEILELVAF